MKPKLGGSGDARLRRRGKLAESLTPLQESRDRSSSSDHAYSCVSNADWWAGVYWTERLSISAADGSEIVRCIDEVLANRAQQKFGIAAGFSRPTGFLAGDTGVKK